MVDDDIKLKNGRSAEPAGSETCKFLTPLRKNELSKKSLQNWIESEGSLGTLRDPHITHRVP